MHGFLLTDDILKLKGIKLPSKCLLCRIEEESFAHLFFGCVFTKMVWGCSVHSNVATIPIYWLNFKEDIEEGNNNVTWRKQLILY